MEFGTFLIGAAAAAIILFLLTGLAQAVTPWGIKAVKEVSKESIGGLTAAIEKQTPPTGMYGIFDERIAALIAVRPGSYYNAGRYMAIEALTQLAVGLLLAGVLAVTVPIGEAAQLGLVALIGLLAGIAIDFQYWNWWGFTPAYAVGFLVNRLVALLVATFVVVRFIF